MQKRRALQRAGDGEHGGARLDGPQAGDGILHIGGGRHGDLAGNGGKLTGGLVIGVVGADSPGLTVKRDSDALQNGIKHIADNGTYIGIGRLAAGVLDHEGIGQLSVFGNGGGADALADGTLTGYGTDVLSTEPPKKDNPLLSAPNCLITPHIAWAAYETRQRLMGILEDNIKGYISGNTVNVVN